MPIGQYLAWSFHCLPCLHEFPGHSSAENINFWYRDCEVIIRWFKGRTFEILNYLKFSSQCPHLDLINFGVFYHVIDVHYDHIWSDIFVCSFSVNCWRYVAKRKKKKNLQHFSYALINFLLSSKYFLSLLTNFSTIRSRHFDRTNISSR